MLKQFLTLIRGQATDAAETVLDGHALTILHQQIRDCAEAVSAARRAVAVAIAQNNQEAQQTDRLRLRIEDLEARALAALEQDKRDLANEAAETIAQLEAERDASLEAQRGFAAEITRLKRTLRTSESRLRELERGQRVAAAADKIVALRDTAPASGLAALKDAEATLARLRTRQKQSEAEEAALREMDGAADPSSVAEKLAEAGCGAPPRYRAEEVLKRLSDRLAAKR